MRELVIHRGQLFKDRDGERNRLPPIGQGAVGKVYGGKYVDSERREHSVVIKSIEKELLGASGVETFFNEARQLSSLAGNKNIVFLYGIAKHRGKSCRTTKYSLIMERGEITLEQYLDEISKSGKTIPLEQKLQLSLDIARGLAEIHRNRMVHHDLKDSNILLFKTGSGAYAAKISDFGLSKVSTHSLMTRSGTGGGTQCWLAPEVVLGCGYDATSDLFSYALILLRIAGNGQKIFDETGTDRSLISLNPINFMRTYMRNIDFRLNIPRDCDETLRRIIEATWRPIYSFDADELRPIFGQSRMSAEEAAILLEQGIVSLRESHLSKIRAACLEDKVNAARALETQVYEHPITPTHDHVSQEWWADAGNILDYFNDLCAKIGKPVFEVMVEIENKHLVEVKQLQKGF